MESLLAPLDLVEDLAALDAQSLGQESALLSSEFADTAAQLASLPWAATPAEDAAARYSVALRCQAVRVLAVLPPTSALPTLKRAMKGALVGLSQVDDAAQCADGNGGEESLAAAMLEALLRRSGGEGHASAFAEFGGPSGEAALANRMLAATQPGLAAGASTGMGASGARAHRAGCASRSRRPSACWCACMPDAATRHGIVGAVLLCASRGGHGGRRRWQDRTGAARRGERRWRWPQSWLPTLWKVRAVLLTDDVAPRVALLRAMARLAQHAPLAMMMRARPVLTSLVRMLDDEQQDVAAACEQVLPRLLGRPEFVRALCHTIGERAALPDDAAQQRAPTDDQPAHVAPRAPSRRVRATRDAPDANDDAHDHGLGCHPLYAAPERRGQVLLALCEHLTADELSVEYGVKMAQLSRLAPPARAVRRARSAARLASRGCAAALGAAAPRVGVVAARAAAARARRHQAARHDRGGVAPRRRALRAAAAVLAAGTARQAAPPSRSRQAAPRRVRRCARPHAAPRRARCWQSWRARAARRSCCSTTCT